MCIIVLPYSWLPLTRGSSAALPSKLPVPPLATRRLLYGVGQQRGRIGVEVINNLETEAEVVWQESWPWWLRAYLSTLEVSVDGDVTTGELPSSRDILSAD